ncbi:hypothetical protein M378DRAFT_166295, partial [Amanita muscaria Koide BX008]
MSRFIWSSTGHLCEYRERPEADQSCPCDDQVVQSRSHVQMLSMTCSRFYALTMVTSYTRTTGTCG